jgi:hypothetical protein
MKSHLLTFLFLTGLGFPLQGMQQTPSFDLEQFLLPVPITRDSLEKFFKLEFNSPRYVDKLTYSLEDCARFLRHGKQTNQGRKYPDATLRLFKLQIGKCEGLSAGALTDLLTELPHLVDYLFVDQSTKSENKKRAVKTVLYREFLSKFKELSANPAAFFDHLADEVLMVANPDAHQEVSTDHLRQIIVRFIETCIGKLFWDPSDKTTWANIKQIGDLLGRLREQNIITDKDDLNDLCWSLVHRVCHFVNVFGPELPMDFYEEVRKEIQNPCCTLLTLEEQEQLISTKCQVLERTVIEGVAKHHAEELGILTQ